MITYKSILESKPSNIHMTYIPSGKSAISKDTASNLADFVTSKGEKIIGVPNIETKNAVQTIIPHHDHKCFITPTIFNLADIAKEKFNTSHIILHHAPEDKNLVDSLNKTHGKSMTISSKEFAKNNTQAKSIDNIHPAIKRPDAKTLLASQKNIKEHIMFSVGDIVTDGVIVGEVLNIHSKYATIISEGVEHKLWTEHLTISDIIPKRNQLYKDSFIYKGYKTKNFTRNISEQFKEITKVVSDEYAALECLKVFDYILGVTDKEISEKFSTVRIQLERLKKYSNTIGANIITEQVASLVEEELLKMSILESYNFTTSDKYMVGRVCAMIADVSIDNSDPLNLVNKAATKLRTSQLNPQGWLMLGKLFNIATNSGIRWNKSTFSLSIQKEMKLI